MQKPKLPITCPACTTTLQVSQLSCPECATGVTGTFSLPALVQLPDEDQAFILRFFLTSGSLKEMATVMGISYPTVRNRLDDLITKVKTLMPEL